MGGGGYGAVVGAGATRQAQSAVSTRTPAGRAGGLRCARGHGDGTLMRLRKFAQADRHAGTAPAGCWRCTVQGRCCIEGDHADCGLSRVTQYRQTMK